MGAYKSFYIPESSEHYPPDRRVETEHVRLELSLDLPNKRVSGTCTLRVRPVGKGVKAVALDAVGLKIESVSLDGAKCGYEYDNAKLSVHLPEELSGRHEISVAYASSPKQGVYFTAPDEEHPERETQAWSHNEAELARYWFPVHDHPAGKSTSELIMTVPKGMRVISNGELLSVKEEADSTTFHWKEDLPHPAYLTSFVAGSFGEVKQESEGVPLFYYFPESKRPDVLRYFGETPKMITVFGELTGVKYPYKKYSQVTVEDFIYGGMENFNATTLATNYYPDAGSEEDFQVTYSSPHTNAVGLVAHELAHQWFGDLVTCAHWSHAYLNEGFATYFQALYLERTRGVDEFRSNMAAKAREFFEEDSDSYRRPVVESKYYLPDDLFDRVTYEKGAWMLHELRYVVGDEAFFAGVKRYLTEHSFGNAETYDLRRAMEKESGLSLGEFFDQAFLKAGFPEFEVDYSWASESNQATVSVRQVQKLESGTPVFALPCDIVFYTREGRVKKKVKVEGAWQSFSFELGSKPDVVEFDPEERLLKKVKFQRSIDMLVSQLGKSVDASSRAEAARALGETKAESAVAFLKEAALREQFWEVRAEALKALGEIGTEEALSAVLQVGPVGHRRVRRGFAAALGSFKGERAKEQLKKLLFEDSSPYVRCEAALSVAKSMPEEAFPLLVKAMESVTPNETLKEACLDAMGKLKDERVAEVLRENLKYGRPARARIGALKGIKKRGTLMNEDVSLIKKIALEDKQFRVRQYLVASLVPEVKDARLLEAMREVAGRPDEDGRLRRDALDATYLLSEASQTSAELAALKEEVAKLREQAPRPKGP